MATEIQAPHPYEKGKFTLFLAGSIDMGSAEEWQAQVVEALADYDVQLLNPRRDDWDSSWKQEADDPQFSEQVNWELDGLAAADFRIFYFAKDSKSPITFGELGESIDLPGVVMCPEGFYRKGNVDIMCERAGMPVAESFEELMEAIQKLLETRGLKTASASSPELYHGTTTENAESIQAQGIFPGNDDLAYATSSLEDAKVFARVAAQSELDRLPLEDADRYAVVVLDGKQSGMEYQGQTFWAAKRVPASAVIRIEYFEGPEGIPVDLKTASTKTASPGVYYHVTFSNLVDRIRKQGIQPGQAANWKQRSNGKAYGRGEVNAFDHKNDAIRWAGRMDWEFHKKLGSGKISILAFSPGKATWESDEESDPLTRVTYQGRWLKSETPVEPAQIRSATTLTPAMVRRVSRIWAGKTAAAHPDVLYHGTSAANRASIRERGLLQSCHPFADEGGCGIFFSAMPGRQPSPWLDTWQVDARGLSLVEDDTTDPPAVADGGAEGDSWWVTYDEDIPPSRLTLIEPKTASGKVAAPRQIFYHGSSVKNLRSILSQGLIPEVKEKNWQEDEDTGFSAPSRVSYGGIYVTRNVRIARGAPQDRVAQGAALVVCMELQPNTFYMDEDDINLQMNAPLGELSGSNYIPGYYIAMTHPGVNASMDTWLEKYRNKFIEAFVKKSNMLFRNEDQPIHPGLEDRMRELLPAMWQASLGRLTAHQAKGMRAWDVSAAYREVFEEVGDEPIPAKEELFPTVAEAEKSFMVESEKLTRAMRLLAQPREEKFRNTARVTEPIGYSGSNHILAVVEIRDGHKYHKNPEDVVDLVVHYGKLPEDFIQQYEETGYNYQVVAPQQVKTAAPPQIFYHGTSYKNLRSVLSQGLIPNVKQKNWDSDDAAGVNMPSRESYGGIYVTRNLMTAYGAPKDHYTLGREVLVVCEMQPNTLYMDEDNLNSTLSSPLGRLSSHNYSVGCAYVAATVDEGVDEEWKQAAEKYKQDYVDDCIASFKYNFESRGETMHPDLEARLRGLLPEVWLPALTRIAAHAFHKASDSDFKRCYTQVVRSKVDWDTIYVKELLPTPDQAEADFRKSSEQVTRTLKLLARPGKESQMFTHARVTEPIGYSGSNHILAVIEMRDGDQFRGKDRKEPAQLVVHYGQIPEDFFTQYKERMGGAYEVVKPETKAAGAKTAQYALTPIELGRAVQKFCASNESYAILDSSRASGGTWSAGGCYILAEAVQKEFGGELYAVVADEAVQHIVVKYGGLFIDADGASREALLLHRMESVEHLHHPKLVLLDPNAVDAEIPRAEKETEIIAGIQPFLPKVERKITSAKTAQHHQFPSWKSYVNQRGGIDKIRPGWTNEYDQEEDALMFMGEDYEGQTGFLNDLTFPLTLHRALDVNPDKVNFDRVGVYWSHDPNGADAYGGNAYSGGFSVLVAEVLSAYDVDFAASLDAYMLNPNEEEIRIHAGAQLRLTEIESLKDHFPQNRMVTAAKTAREEEMEADNADFNDDGYWAGEGNAASGILAIAKDTKRLCLAWRNVQVHTGDCWGLIGGAVKDGMEPAASAKSEMKEEVGYAGGVELHPGYVFQDNGFSFHNFVGLVDGEFSFNPAPRHAWETDYIEWFTLDEILADMKENQGDFHPGVITFFKESRELIEKLVKGDAKTAAALPRPANVHAAIMYHASHPSNRDSIVEHGLQRSQAKPMYRYSVESEGHKGIFFATRQGESQITSHPWADIWRVDVRGIPLLRDDTQDGDDAIEHGYWVTYDRDIPPSRLKLLPGPDGQVYPVPTDVKDKQAGLAGTMTAIPKGLAGLAAEAKKCATFEEFRTDFHMKIKHGQYWHVTADANFTIDAHKGPRDMSSMADGGMDAGKLMITSHLENWTNYYNYDRDEKKKVTRPYAALIDMAEVPRQMYSQVSRGFGNEFMVVDPTQARVQKVMPVDAALAKSRRYASLLSTYLSSNEDLERFWEIATGAKIENAKTAGLADEQREERMLAFMREFRSLTGPSPDPDNSKDRTWKDAVEIEAHMRWLRIQVESIRSLEQGQGNASKALDFLKDLADKHDVELEVHPVPFGGGQLNQPQLKEWYTRHGFTLEDASTYVYHPAPEAKTASDHPLADVDDYEVGSPEAGLMVRPEIDVDGMEKEAAAKVASPEDLEMLKGELTMSDRDKGEEMARYATFMFKEFIEKNYPDLTSLFGTDDEDGYIEDYSGFADNVLIEFMEEAGPYELRNNPAEAPTFLTVDFVRDVKDEWLIHFTDHAEDIAAQGFKYGIDDVRMLALTTYFTDKAKTRGGYNFAYLPKDLWRHESGEYGKDCVIFKATGIETWHHGDQFPQVIFWGADAHSITSVRATDDGWTVYPRGSHGEPLFESEDLHEVLNWVTENHKPPRRKKKTVRTASVKHKTARVIGPVYHGTTYDFAEFKRTKGLRSGFLGSVQQTDVFAYFFTLRRQQAIDYARNRQQETKQQARLITAHLTMHNMLDLTNPDWVNTQITHPPLPLHKAEESDTDDIYEDHADDLESASGLLDYLVNYLLVDEMTGDEWGELGIDDGRYGQKGEPKLEEGFTAYFLFDNKKVSDALRYLGFDGAKVPEGDDAQFGGESYCVFSTNQVRIASNQPIDDKYKPKAAKLLTRGTEPDIDDSQQTNSPAFQAWFQGSKVVDGSGNPLVVYHGTGSDIDVFQPYTHFGTQGAANSRLKWRKKFKFKDQAVRMMPCYLAIQRPFPMTDQEANDDAILNEAVKRGDYPELAQEWGYLEPIMVCLQRLGYDGISYQNTFEGGVSWINFFPNQVKSAIGNSGEFDSANHKITASKTGSTDAERQLQVDMAEDDWRLPNMLEILPDHYLNTLLRKVFTQAKQDPESPVTIYRSVPPDVQDGIRPGDWVALEKQYVEGLGRGKTLSQTVPAQDVVWSGTDQSEYFYAPKAQAKTSASRSTTLYRGSSNGHDLSPGRTYYFAFDSEYAKGYGQYVRKYVLDPSAKILDGSTGDGARVLREMIARRAEYAEIGINPFDAGLPLYSSAYEVEREAKQTGYDGVVYSELNNSGGNGERSIGIWNLDKVREDETVAVTAAVAEEVMPVTETPAFKAWFAGSKIVDDAGKPRPLYHGTVSDFDTFDVERAGSVQYSDWGKGISLTPSPRTADYYRGEAAKLIDPKSEELWKQLEALERQATWSNGSSGTPTYPEGYDDLLKEWRATRAEAQDKAGVVMPLYARIEKPYIIGYQSTPDPSAAKYAQEHGYDGIVVLTGPGTMDEVIAFHPSQVKSALGNSGAFDANDHRITAAKVDGDLGNDKYEVRLTQQLGADPVRYYYLIEDRKTGDVKAWADTPEEVQTELERLAAPPKPKATPKSRSKPPATKRLNLQFNRTYNRYEMLAAGADGYLTRAVVMRIPVAEIVGREPIPAMDGGYKKGTPITQPVEVEYDPEQGYILYSGNHRVRQAEINGDTTILAFVEKPPTAKTAAMSQSDIDYWSRYGGNMKFKSESEARDWVYRKLQLGDEQYGELFGVAGPEKNRAKADSMPLYKDGRDYKLGKKPGVSKERLGTEAPEGDVPDTDWYNRDNQDGDGAVSEASILRDYNGGKPALVYMSYVNTSDIPDPILAEDAEREDADEDDDDQGGYNWEEFAFKNRRGFPPMKLRVTSQGKVQIMDGNHRLTHWKERGFGSVPAWVIDQRKGVKLKQAYLSPKNAELTVIIDLTTRKLITILLDLGIPRFTTFDITIPIEDLDEREAIEYAHQAFSALLDEVLAFMVSLHYDDARMVEFTKLAEQCWAELNFEDATDHELNGKDPTLRMYEAVFELPVEFIEETHQKVVIAGTLVRRIPERREIVLKQVKTSPIDTNAARAIQLFRNRSLKSLPKPFYIMLYDQKGRVRGALPLARNWQSRLLKRV
jgi:RNA:NAD 2'-phosphotransferase (TPT1/KptA family)/8-oxo-dGTP pyrophosphatase MutT (NUDIX family)